MNHTEIGLSHLARGDLGQAVAAFWTATQGDERHKPWVELGVALVMAGRWREFAGLVNATNVPIQFLHSVCHYFMNRGDYRVLGEMRTNIPPENPGYPVAVYFAGVSRIAAKDYAGSLVHFHAFKGLMLNDLERFEALLTDPNFGVVFRQGTLVEPLAYVAALDDGSHPVEDRDPTVELRRRAGNDRSPVLFACCLNDLYFMRFAETLAASLTASCGPVDLHFHVMGSQVDIMDTFDALVVRHPEISFGLSLEREPLERNSVYYACNRFLVMPQLAEIYRKDIMTLDADALVTHDLTSLSTCVIAGPEVCDFACFDTGITEPASVYQATLMYFADTAGCRDFVRLLRRYISPKLGQPDHHAWMLDQAALFSVSLYLESLEDRPFVFRRFGQVTGLTMANVVGADCTPQEKRLLRKDGALN